MHTTKLLMILMLMVGLAGCGKPVPPEKANYVGQWSGPSMQLLITQSGRVEYERIKGGATTSVSGPIQEFDGDNFSVGISFISTRFVVSRPPYQENDTWKMVVDDVVLTKVQ